MSLLSERSLCNKCLYPWASEYMYFETGTYHGIAIFILCEILFWLHYKHTGVLGDTDLAGICHLENKVKVIGIWQEENDVKVIDILLFLQNGDLHDFEWC